MDPVKSLAQMQVTREEKFWPWIKKFGPPLAVFGSGVSRPGQLEVPPFKGPDKPTKAPLPVCQKPCDGGEGEKCLNRGPKTKEVGPPLLIVGIGEPGHLRQIQVLPYKQPEEPSQALHPQAAAPNGEAVCPKPCEGGEEEESLNCGLKTKEVAQPLAIVGLGASGQQRQIKVLPNKQPDKPRPALPPNPAATKPRKISGFDEAKHQRLRPLRWKVHPAPVLVSEQAEDLTQTLPLEPEKRGSSPKPEDSSPAPRPTKRLGLGTLMEKFREYREQKDQMRKKKAEEQYVRWTAKKLCFPGMFSEQQNEAYARGFDAGRKGIIKSMF